MPRPLSAEKKIQREAKAADLAYRIAEMHNVPAEYTEHADIPQDSQIIRWFRNAHTYLPEYAEALQTALGTRNGRIFCRITLLTNISQRTRTHRVSILGDIQYHTNNSLSRTNLRIPSDVTVAIVEFPKYRQYAKKIPTEIDFSIPL